MITVEVRTSSGDWQSVPDQAPVRVAASASASLSWQLEPGRYRAVIAVAGAPPGTEQVISPSVRIR
jgi:hypothetical protein